MFAILFDPAQTFILAAIINGLVFCVLLLGKPENRIANRYLSILIFSACYSLATQIGIDLGIFDLHPWLHWLPGGLIYLIGPAFFLYVKSLTEPGFAFHKKHLWHFSWIIFDYFHSVYHLVYGRNVPYPRLHNFTEAIDVYVIFPLLVYVYFSVRLIRKYRLKLLDHLTILSIALDAGFNSKATFNRIFKAYTGMSPRVYREKSRSKEG